MNDNVLLSGGASGADLQWGMTAGMAGHSVVHFSFAGHRTQAPDVEVIILSKDQLEAADEACMAASKRIKRWFPPKSLFVRNLLRRNWYQVKDAERVYAVATIKDGLVQGGTGWAISMWLDRHNDEPSECYVFDQVEDAWFMWDNQWVKIDQPPMPHGIWAGIGSRDLSNNGKLAIRKLMKYV
jgi:hypothetical protein